MHLFPSLFIRQERQNAARTLGRMQHQLDRMFDNFFANDASTDLTALTERAFQPPCELQETDSHYLLSFELPGLAKQDIQVELLDHTLRVSGERKDERKSGKGEGLRTERYYGKLERSIVLPLTIKADSIETHFENGVLHVAVPKAEAIKPQKIAIGDGKSVLFNKLLGKAGEKIA